jgi:hypothetical protein
MTFIGCSSKKTIVKGTEKRDLFEPKEYKNILTESKNRYNGTMIFYLYKPD